MDLNRSLMEAELKALMEVSTDFARGLSTVAARMKVLKACLDNPHNGHVSRVDRATSPIVFRTDRSTSISPLRFKSPVKCKEESVDIAEETVANAHEEQNYCDISINQENISGDYYNEKEIDNSQNRRHVISHEEPLIEVSSDDAASSCHINGVPATVTSQVVTVPMENSSTNLRKSYYVVNPANGLAIPIDVSQIKELGLSSNPVQQITVQNNQLIEEDILYAMQANKKGRCNNIDACSTVATVGTFDQEILLSSEEENASVISDRVFAARLPPLTRNHGIKKKTNVEKREYNRVRQARYRANQQRRIKERIEREKQNAITANKLNSILNSNVEKDTHNVLILRKELIKRTYARGVRQADLQTNQSASGQMETS